jgi:hypothetical protein
MNKQDNFEDNLYLLFLRIKLIRDTLTLNVDPGLFAKKTMEDIDFTAQILEVFLKKLEENQHRIYREELLDHLFEIEGQFSVILSDMTDGSRSVSAGEIEALQDRISVLQKASLERRETIESLCAAIGDYPEEPVISTNELNELLKDFN